MQLPYLRKKHCEGQIEGKELCKALGKLALTGNAIGQKEFPRPIFSIERHGCVLLSPLQIPDVIVCTCALC